MCTDTRILFVESNVSTLDLERDVRDHAVLEVTIGQIATSTHTSKSLRARWLFCEIERYLHRGGHA